jgi:hypothetical protein
MTTNISQTVNEAGILEFIPQMFTILTTLVVQAIPLIFIIVLLGVMVGALIAVGMWIAHFFRKSLKK